MSDQTERRRKLELGGWNFNPPTPSRENYGHFRWSASKAFGAYVANESRDSEALLFSALEEKDRWEAARPKPFAAPVATAVEDAPDAEPVAVLSPIGWIREGVVDTSAARGSVGKPAIQPEGNPQ